MGGGGGSVATVGEDDEGAAGGAEAAALEFDEVEAEAELPDQRLRRRRVRVVAGGHPSRCRRRVDAWQPFCDNPQVGKQI